MADDATVNTSFYLPPITAFGVIGKILSFEAMKTRRIKKEQPLPNSSTKILIYAVRLISALVLKDTGVLETLAFYNVLMVVPKMGAGILASLKNDHEFWKKKRQEYFIDVFKHLACAVIDMVVIPWMNRWVFVFIFCVEPLWNNTTGQGTLDFGDKPKLITPPAETEEPLS